MSSSKHRDAFVIVGFIRHRPTRGSFPKTPKSGLSDALQRGT
jgi:hypothetical protein